MTQGGTIRQKPVSGARALWFAIAVAAFVIAVAVLLFRSIEPAQAVPADAGASGRAGLVRMAHA